MSAEGDAGQGVSVVVHIEEERRPGTVVSGQLESRYGTRSFTGWLDLLGQLEALMERSRRDATPSPRTPSVSSGADLNQG